MSWSVTQIAKWVQREHFILVLQKLNQGHKTEKINVVSFYGTFR